MTAPKPRRSSFAGMVTDAVIHPDGTWLEPEELCYPSGGMLRRAYATCEDGVKRVCVCGIPDTFFSIPARVRVKGGSARGYLSMSDTGGIKFTAYAG